MKCTDVYLFICDNLDQKLDSPQCREIKRHLESCSDCSAYLDSVKKTVQLYRTFSIPHVPAATHRKLLKTINLEWAPGSNTRKSRTSSGTRDTPEKKR